MPKLYELSKELATINDQLITNEGEITPDLEARLDQVQIALTEKATGLRKWFAMIDADRVGLETEIKRLQNLLRLQNNLSTRLEAYIKKNMEVADLKKIETPIGTFTLQKNPPSVEIIAEVAIPDDFKRTIPERKEPDKKKMLEAFKEGYDVPGAKYIDDRTHLRIK